MLYVIESCSIRGSVVFTGNNLVAGTDDTFKPYGVGQALYIPESGGCNLSSAAFEWSINGNVFDAPNGVNRVSFNLANYSKGEIHTVKCVVKFTYLSENESRIGSVTASAHFTVQTAPLIAVLQIAGTEVPTSVNVSLDASLSIEPTDPCYIAAFEGPTTLRRCMTQLSLTQYNETQTPLVFRFTCIRNTDSRPCPYSPEVLVRRGLHLQIESEKISIITYTPMLSLPAGSLPAGDYSFAVALQRGERTSVSNAVILRITEEKSYIFATTNLIAPVIGNSFIGNFSVFINSTVITDSRAESYRWDLTILKNGTKVDMKTPGFRGVNTSALRYVLLKY